GPGARVAPVVVAGSVLRTLRPLGLAPRGPPGVDGGRGAAGGELPEHPDHPPDRRDGADHVQVPLDRGAGEGGGREADRHPAFVQEDLERTIGGDQAQWRAVAASWEQMGLVTRVPAGRSYRLYLATRMGEVVRGKCPRCGRVAEAPKGMFLEQTTCGECRASVVFVLLAKPPAREG
ncbi:MAG: hypothetical protein JWO31_3549, partial [Phycisphaerales bacterium]|nr:hypothetical protein [Phycisphaerales bacterium]